MFNSNVALLSVSVVDLSTSESDADQPERLQWKEMATVRSILDRMEEGHRLFSMGDYTEAIEKYREVLHGDLSGVDEKHPSTALSFGNLGRALMATSLFGETGYNLKKAVSLSANPAYRENLAKFYEGKGYIASAGRTRRKGEPGNMACANDYVRRVRWDVRASTHRRSFSVVTDSVDLSRI